MSLHLIPFPQVVLTELSYYCDLLLRFLFCLKYSSSVIYCCIFFFSLIFLCFIICAIIVLRSLSILVMLPTQRYYYLKDYRDYWYCVIILYIDPDGLLHAFPTVMLCSEYEYYSSPRCELYKELNRLKFFLLLLMALTYQQEGIWVFSMRYDEQS